MPFFPITVPPSTSAPAAPAVAPGAAAAPLAAPAKPAAPGSPTLGGAMNYQLGGLPTIPNMPQIQASYTDFNNMGSMLGAMNVAPNAPANRQRSGQGGGGNDIIAAIQQLMSGSKRGQMEADLQEASTYAPRYDSAGTMRDRGGFLAPSDYAGPSAEEIGLMRDFGLGLSALRNQRGLVDRAAAAGKKGYNEFQKFKSREELGPVMSQYVDNLNERAARAMENRLRTTGSMMPQQTPMERAAEYARSQGINVYGNEEDMPSYQLAQGVKFNDSFAQNIREDFNRLLGESGFGADADQGRFAGMFDDVMSGRVNENGYPAAYADQFEETYTNSTNEGLANIVRALMPRVREYVAGRNAYDQMRTRLRPEMSFRPAKDRS